MTRFTLPALVLLLSFLAASGAFAQKIETPRFRVTLKEGGALEVFDKQSSTTWVQPGAQVAITDLSTTASEFTFTLGGQYRVAIAVGSANIDLTLSADGGQAMDTLDYPAGFSLATPVASQRLLLPNCAGLAIPFAMRHEPALRPVIGTYDAVASQRGLMMPWIGVDAGPVGTLMLLTTPFDAEMKVALDAEGYRYAASWQSVKGRFGYDRSVRYLFASEGGMVALCKQYRAYAEEHGLHVSLQEKRKTAPQLDRFLGAMSLWISDWPDLDLLKKIKASGIDRLLVSYHSTEEVPASARTRLGRNPTYEAVDRDFAQQVHALGFLVGRYDYYRTIFPPGDRAAEGNGWIMREIGYPEQLALDENGEIRPGFAARPGAPRENIRGNRASRPQYELALAYIPLDVDRVGYDARLMDAVVAVSLQEDFSPLHPATRVEDMQWRQKQLKVPADCNQITGTEAYAAWAVPVSVYGEGPTTFVRFFRANTPPGSRLKPSVPLDMPDEYRRVVLNERLRAPLWQLVFADASVLTNRWNITANRYTNPQDWDQEDLLNLLHGHMPTMLINRATYPAVAVRLARTYETVCRWNATVAYQEMTDFRWLDEQGGVQQATYASGRNVVVNFTSTEFALPDGTRVPARSYVTR